MNGRVNDRLNDRLNGEAIGQVGVQTQGHRQGC
jgi:hypothetical protein